MATFLATLWLQASAPRNSQFCTGLHYSARLNYIGVLLLVGTVILYLAFLILLALSMAGHNAFVSGGGTAACWAQLSASPYMLVANHATRFPITVALGKVKVSCTNTIPPSLV